MPPILGLLNIYKLFYFQLAVCQVSQVIWHVFCVTCNILHVTNANSHCHSYSTCQLPRYAHSRLVRNNPKPRHSGKKPFFSIIARNIQSTRKRVFQAGTDKQQTDIPTCKTNQPSVSRKIGKGMNH